MIAEIVKDGETYVISGKPNHGLLEMHRQSSTDGDLTLVKRGSPQKIFSYFGAKTAKEAKEKQPKYFNWSVTTNSFEHARISESSLPMRNTNGRVHLRNKLIKPRVSTASEQNYSFQSIRDLEKQKNRSRVASKGQT